MRSPRRLLLTTAVAVGVGLTTTAVSTAAPPPPTPPDRQFLVAAQQGNLAEILSGSGAAARGSCPQVRDIGAVLVADHGRLDAMGAAVAVPNGVPLPLSPDPDQLRQIGDTGNRMGRDFDLAWLRRQEGFHTRTLQAIAGETATGTAPQVTAVADAAEPVVTHHLALIRDAMSVC